MNLMIFFFSFIWLNMISSFFEISFFWFVHFLIFSSNQMMILSSFLIVSSKTSSFLIIMQMILIMLVFFSFTPEKNSFKFLNWLLWAMMWSVLIFFMSENIFIFFFSFEMTMIPIILMIYGWGYQVERIKSVSYMFFYLLFSVFPSIFALGIIFLKFNSIYFLNSSVNSNIISFIVSLPFLVKLPIFFFHNWLTLAHVEAPGFGSVFLAAVLLKTGGFGLYKINFFLFMDMSINLIIIFLTCSIILSCIIMIFQSDLKAWIAFSSITHMTLCALCFFFYSSLGFSLFLVSLFSHAFTSGILFFLAHMIQYGVLTRNIFFLPGINYIKTSISFIIISSIFLNLGFPFSLNFMTELVSISNLANYFYILGVLISMFLIMFMSVLSIFICSSILHGKKLFFIFKLSDSFFNSMVVSMIFLIGLFSFLWSLILN